MSPSTGLRMIPSCRQKAAYICIHKCVHECISVHRGLMVHTCYLCAYSVVVDTAEQNVCMHIVTSLTKRDISLICISSVESLDATLQPSVSRRDLSRATAVYTYTDKLYIYTSKCMNILYIYT